MSTAKSARAKAVKPGADPNRLVVFDTTLRDGEQSPGATMNQEEKIQVARALYRLKVDVIEAGFPIASPGDHDAVKAIAEDLDEKDAPIICGLARSLEKDIRSAASAVKNARRPRIHVFLATSAIHRQFKLKKAKDEIVKQAVEAVTFARSLVEDIEFSPEDASRTEPEFLCEVTEAVIAAGASTVNIPDTVGYAIPDQFGSVIRTLKEKVPNIEDAVISVHCHNDLGLAVANSLAGVRNGARQVECTINGIGERAGNAALEELVMALRTRHDFFPYVTGIDSRRILPTSKLVSNITGIHVQRNKAVVGENAFAHESGIHQDGVLKERTTYEIMRPEDVGVEKSMLVLGKHSGKHAFKNRLKDLGYDLEEKPLVDAFEKFKTLCDKKKTIYDADLIALVEDQLVSSAPVWELELLQVASGNKAVPTATVILRREKAVYQDAATGDGPIDALTKAIDRITGVSGKILDYQVRAVSEGREAQGEVDIKCDFDGEVLYGRGFSTDIIEASAKAYLNAVCRACAKGDTAVKKTERPGHVAPKPVGATP
ncbi:MAG: 2-isopropylmalate synthase [Planctomycetota bacterium]|nr:2-isopropylmalate synthase [Planctomycetota bacterium]